MTSGSLLRGKCIRFGFIGGIVGRLGCFERLEDRRLLAVSAGAPELWTLPAVVSEEATSEILTVTTCSDTVDANDGLLSLREALAKATEGTIIRFDSPLAGKTIVLSGKELTVSVSLTIDATSTPGITIDGAGKSRVFSIETGKEVTLATLKITGGSSDKAGGGIFNAGTLTLTNCAVVENSAPKGGGIETSGALTLLNCTIAGNSAEEGGGIAVTAGSLTLKNTIAVENGAKNNADLFAEKGTSLSASYVLSSFSGWSKSDHLVNYGVKDQIFADSPNGIWTLALGSPAVDTGNNNFITAVENDLAGYRRIQNMTVDLGAYETGIASAVRVSSWSAIEDGEKHGPELEGLLPGDTAEYSLDGGVSYQNYISSPPVFSDRGSYPITFRVRRNGYQDWTTSDAYEVQEIPSSLVTTLDDVIDATDGIISLREAILYTPDGGTVTFAESLAGKTIALAGEELLIANAITIDASDLADILTISGSGASRVFRVTGGTAQSPIELTALKITGGYTNENGGGIYAEHAVLKLSGITLTENAASEGGGLFTEGGDTTIANCFVEKNRAALGGGIETNGGTVTVTDTEVISNTAYYHYGGGIENRGGTVTMTDSTVTKNGASNGGGIDVDNGVLTMTNCFITDNTALRTSGSDGTSYSGGYGGGVYNFHGTVSLVNCALTGNKASNWGGAVETYGDLVMINGTVASNKAEYGGGLDVDCGSANSVKLYNSIIACNTAYSDSNDICLSSGSVSAYHTLSSFTEWTDSVSPFEYDGSVPIFTDPEKNLFTLRRGTRCVNSGSNQYVSVTADIAGKTRIVGGAVDLGAYEIQESPSKLSTPEIITGGPGFWAGQGLNRQKIMWKSVEGASRYELSYTENGILWTSKTAEETSAVIIDLKYDALIQYKVRALGDGNEYLDSDWSDVKGFYVCPVDIDNDGLVGPGDFSAISAAWFAYDGDDNWNPACDIDGDGVVGPGDYAFLSANWLRDSDFVYPA